MSDTLQKSPKPAHVPDDMFIPGNIWESMGNDPHGRLRQLTAGRDLVYLQTHHHPGHSPNGTWLSTSAEASRQILLDTDSFPSSGASVFKILGGLTFFPIESDPPDHAKWRALLAPFFKPAAVNALSGTITSRVDELLDGFVDEGRCDFVPQFAQILPAMIFLALMGLPLERAQEFLGWARAAIDQSSTPDEKVAALKRSRDYLADEIRSRRDRPMNDVLSGIANSEIDGRHITVDEATGGAMVLFLGGLDTVANLLSWIFYQLAISPDIQAELRDDPSKINRAIEEFMRFYAPVTMSRRAAKTTEVCGTTIKQGDTVCCSMTLASRDESEFSNPDVLDISQPQRRHLNFGYGPHTCIGMHLARLELKIVIERWFARVPMFRVEDGADVPMRGASVLGINALPLVWG